MKKFGIVFLCMMALAGMLAITACDDSDSTPASKLDVSSSVTAQGIPSADGTLTAAVVANTGAATATGGADGKASTVVVATIPANAKVLQADGTPVTQPVTVTVAASDPNSEATFEGKSFSITDQNNQKGTFASAGHMSINLSAGTQTIGSISEPITVELAPTAAVAATLTEGAEQEVVAWASPLQRFTYKVKFLNKKFTIQLKYNSKASARFECQMINNFFTLISNILKYNIGIGVVKPTAT